MYVVVNVYKKKTVKFLSNERRLLNVRKGVDMVQFLLVVGSHLVMGGN